MKVEFLKYGDKFVINSTHKIMRYVTNTCTKEWAKILSNRPCKVVQAGISPKVTFGKTIKNPYGHPADGVYLDSVGKNNFVKELISDGSCQAENAT